MKRLMTLTVVVMMLAACAPKYVRQSDMPDINEAALSTRLDKKDLDQLFDDNMMNLMTSPLMAQWQKEGAGGSRAVVAIFPVNNETSEHIDEQLSTLLSKMETKLVGSGAVSVVSRERQRQLVDEMRLQESAAFDPTQSARLGQMLGSKYFLTGKIYSNTEATKNRRRVQYSLFLQVANIQTSQILWQNTSELTKGMVK